MDTFRIPRMYIDTLVTAERRYTIFSSLYTTQLFVFVFYPCKRKFPEINSNEIPNFANNLLHILFRLECNSIFQWIER